MTDRTKKKAHHPDKLQNAPPSDSAREIRETWETLREGETRFRAVFENSRDAIGVSLVGRHVFVNPA